MIGRLMRDSVTVSRAPFTDGPRRERDWSMAATHVLEPCSLQPGTSSVDTDERRSYSEGATLFAQPGSDIQAGDRVYFGGVAYEVFGIPLEMRSLTGNASHIRCELRRWS